MVRNIDGKGGAYHEPPYTWEEEHTRALSSGKDRSSRHGNRRAVDHLADALPVQDKSLLHFEIFSCLFATVGDQLVLDRLTFVEGAQSCTLHSRDVHEHIFAASTLRLDKPIALGRVKPFHSSCW